MHFEMREEFNILQPTKVHEIMAQEQQNAYIFTGKRNERADATRYGAIHQSIAAAGNECGLLKCGDHVTNVNARYTLGLL
jgi:hypothetical protein